MTCTLYLVVSTSLLSDSLSGAAVPRSMCSLVSLMFLLPCLLLTDLRPVSTLSLLCSLAHILIRWSAGSCFDRILTGTPGWVESHDRFASFLILTRHFFFCLCITATCFRIRGTVKCSMHHTSYPARSKHKNMFTLVLTCCIFNRTLIIIAIIFCLFYDPILYVTQKLQTQCIKRFYFIILNWSTNRTASVFYLNHSNLSFQGFMKLVKRGRLVEPYGGANLFISAIQKNLSTVCLCKLILFFQLISCFCFAFCMFGPLICIL